MRVGNGPMQRVIMVCVALALALAGCGGSSSSSAKPKAADVAAEANQAYQGFQEASRTWTDEKEGRGTNADQLATQVVTWKASSPAKIIDIMSWYSEKLTQGGFGPCPDAPVPDLSSNRTDYCKTVDDRPHRAVVQAGNRGDVESPEIKVTYTIGLPKKTVTTHKDEVPKTTTTKAPK